MNRSLFVARTTKDVELRYSSGNEPVAVATTSIAVDDGFGDRKRTSFFDIVIFGKRGEAFEKYVRKGQKVALICHAQQDTWTTKEGQKRSAVKFIVDEWEFAESKSEDKNERDVCKEQETWTSAEEEELPFM